MLTDAQVERLIDALQRCTRAAIIYPVATRLPLEHPLKRDNAALALLVQIGPRAIPNLLKHLGDQRLTKVVVPEKGRSSRLRTAFELTPFNLNDETTYYLDAEKFTSSELTSYTFKVGDVCQEALGQIVHRNLDPFGYSRAGWGIVSATSGNPVLRKATVQEFSGAENRLEKILVQDATSFPSKDLGFAPRALELLLAYYPATGVSMAKKMLGRKVYNSFPSVTELLLVLLNESDWAKKEQLIRSFEKSLHPAMRSTLPFELSLPR